MADKDWGWKETSYAAESNGIHMTAWRSWWSVSGQSRGTGVRLKIGGFASGIEDAKSKCENAASSLRHLCELGFDKVETGAM